MAPKTIRAFEHERLRRDEPLRTTDGVTIRLTQAHLDALARFNDAHGQRFFKLGYRSVCMREHVGYVQVGNLAIEILPKADRIPASAGEQLRWKQALLEMLRVATGLRLHRAEQALQAAARSSLLDLVAQSFLEELTQLLRQGLAKGYREARENRSAFRGRLLVAENIRHNAVHAHRFYVAHTVYDPPILINRILRRALDVLRALALPAYLQPSIDGARLALSHIPSGPVDAEAFERLQLSRNTMRYRPALQYARMILLNEAPALRAGPLPVIALLFDMNTLWERYIGRLFRRCRNPTLNTTLQHTNPFWRAAGRSARTVRPDIVVTRTASGDAALVVDIKWKLPRTREPAVGDLKQMFVYNELYRCPQSLLLYPAAGDEQRSVHGRFASGGHTCGTAYIGLFVDGRLQTQRVQAQIETLLRRVVRAPDETAPATSQAQPPT